MLSSILRQEKHMSSAEAICRITFNIDVDYIEYLICAMALIEGFCWAMQIKKSTEVDFVGGICAAAT